MLPALMSLLMAASARFDFFLSFFSMLHFNSNHAHIVNSSLIIVQIFFSITFFFRLQIVSIVRCKNTSGIFVEQTLAPESRRLSFKGSKRSSNFHTSSLIHFKINWRKVFASSHNAEVFDQFFQSNCFAFAMQLTE
eukprot:Pompholyxophrys_punicea_v1_NODE_1566_length_643_cov_62.275510.p2 type:complete len:136 gc:universal NODE_1566_length_643_cov_62.275510:610-203(-)